MNQKKYLIKWARSRKALKSDTPNRIGYDWIFYGDNYRNVKNGIPITCYDTEEAAKEAIAKEKQLLLEEKRQ